MYIDPTLKTGGCFVSLICFLQCCLVPGTLSYTGAVWPRAVDDWLIFSFF